jgi:alpha-tubulin suppressor-like RCC1 family protein
VWLCACSLTKFCILAGLKLAAATELSTITDSSVYSVKEYSGSQHSFEQTMSREGGIRQLSGLREHSIAILKDGGLALSGISGPWMEPPASLQRNAKGFAGVAAGVEHTLVILSTNGGVVAWGNDTLAAFSSMPSDVASGSAGGGAAWVAAGAQHSLVLCKDGTLRAWGKDFGQIGIPTEVSSGKVKAIAAGAYHNLAIMDTGVLVAWGTYQDMSLVTVPPELQSSSTGRTAVIAISAGYDYSLALTADGTVHAFGVNPSGVLEVPSRARTEVKAIAAGWNHSVALLESGEIVTWGDTSLGQTLGLPLLTSPVADRVEASLLQTFVLTRIDTTPPPDSTPFDTTPAPPFLFHMSVPPPIDYPPLAMVRPTPPLTSPPSQSPLPPSTGSDTMPQEGYGAFSWGDKYTSLVLQRGVAAVSLGWHHALLLMADGSVQAYGVNLKGQTYVPQDKIGNRATAVAAGGNHSLVLLSDGSVVAFGSNDNKQVDPLPPEVLPGGMGAIAIAAGFSFSLIVLRSGAVVGVGSNIMGELNIPHAAQFGVTTVSAMGLMCAALKSSGELLVWGFNVSEGSNGIMTGLPSNVNTVGVANVSVGMGHIAAMLQNGQVALWGDNMDGQVTLTQEIMASGIVTVVAGGWHTLLLTKAGQVHAIGFNESGQVSVPRGVNNPTEAGTLGSVSAIAAGWHSSWALRPLQAESATPSPGNLLTAHEHGQN